VEKLGGGGGGKGGGVGERGGGGVGLTSEGSAVAEGRLNRAEACSVESYRG